MQKGFSKFKNGVMFLYSALASLALVILIVAAFTQVVGRYVMNASPSWTEECSRFAFIWCSALGTAIALDKGSHAAITILSEHLAVKGRKILQTFLTLIILAISVMIAVKGFELAAATVRTPSPAIRIPMAFVNASVCFAGVGMTISSINTLLSSAGSTESAETPKESAEGGHE